MPWRKSLHWIALRRISGIYYNLDSDLRSPLAIGKEDAMKSYIQLQLENEDRHLLIVLTNEASESNSWLRPKKDE